LKGSNIKLELLLLISLSLLCAGCAAGAGQMNSSTDTAGGTTQVQGIWSVSLKGISQVTLALHQDGDDLFGSASLDGDMPWNAAVLGEISGNRMELILTSLQDKSLVSTKLTGTLEGDYFKGSFVQADDQGMADGGMFSAVLINPDLSAYSPVITESPAGSTAAPVMESPAVASQTQPTQLGNPRYRDVHTMTGMVPESLGVGFIGDGTSGLGGMGMG
jgi:hypothetical protein